VVATIQPSVPSVSSLQHPLAATTDPQHISSQIIAGLGVNAPSFPFPPFTGDNPNLWITLAEQYFSMFATHESYWVPMSILHFSGAAGVWLQLVYKKIAALDWISFTSLLCTHFGRDRHQLLIRQFYSIKQTTTVADHIEHFDILINHLVSYSDTTHPYYFLTRFVEGPRADIRAVVMVQRPTDLDTACSLALLQEEVIEGECISPPRPLEHKFITFPRWPTTASTPTASTAPPSQAADSRGLESSRPNSNNRLNALRNYRKAKGRCFKCGERWGPEHSCPQTVQMDVVEELLELFSQEELTGSKHQDSGSDELETTCSLSVHAPMGSTVGVSGVIQLQAFIEKHEVLILIDSGSSTSFINSQLATHVSSIRPLPRP
jgi:hypothetical protein